MELSARNDSEGETSRNIDQVRERSGENMPIIMEICEEGYVMLVRYIKPATMEEMIKVVTEGRAYRDSVLHTVHTLFDYEHCDILPPRGLKARYSPVFTHPR